MNEAEKIIETIMDKEKLATHAQVANFLSIAASTLHGLITRNSVKTIKKHLRFKNFEIDEKEEQPLNMADVRAQIKNKDQNINEKEKFFLTCEKYKITLEDIAAVTETSVEEVKKRKKETIPTSIFGNYDELLSKCFFKKYQDLMRDRVATAEAKRTLFAETYLMTVKFPKPLFWLIWCCIGFFIFEEKIKGEVVEDFLDILIQNRKNFGDDLATITTSEELIDIVLAKVEDILLKPKIDPVEEFVKQSTNP